jgi:prophage maintenance system killer protein
MALAAGLLCQGLAGLITPQVLEDLKSDRWQVRRDAFEHLAAVKDGPRQPRIQALLIELRERENQESEKEAPDLFENDDYLAYDAQLTPLVEQIAETTNNTRAWRALVYMRYNGDSATGNWIAAHRQCLPYLLEQIHSRYSVRRMNAVYVIASMLAKAKASNHPFPPAQYNSLKAMVRRLALNDIDFVAFSAAEGLALTHDTGDAEAVERVSARLADPHARQIIAKIAQQIRDANRGQTNQPQAPDGAGPRKN